MLLSGHVHCCKKSGRLTYSTTDSICTKKQNSPNILPYSNQKLPVGFSLGRVQVTKCRKRKLYLSSPVNNKVEQTKMETNEISQYSALFMKTRGRGIGYAHPVEGIRQQVHTIAGSVLINGRLTVDKPYAMKKMHVEQFLHLAGPFREPPLESRFAERLQAQLCFLLGSDFNKLCLVKACIC